MMSSYFAANSYMPTHNGGVVPAEHPHHHHHHHQHYGATVQTGGALQNDPANGCGNDPSVVGLRQGIPPSHHYGAPLAAGQAPQGMPYPRFPPYDKLDMRNAAAYYGAQQQQMDAGYRPDSPNNNITHMTPNTVNQNGHQTPVAYASCKLQAAAMTQGGVMANSSSPPLESNSQNTMVQQHHMTNHHDHHMQNAHHQQQQQQQQQHILYTNPGGAGVQNTQNMIQQAPHPQPPAPQVPPQSQPPNNTASALPSPLYPWMRSQFGKLF